MQRILFLAAALAFAAPAFSQTAITPPPSGNSGDRTTTTENPPAGQPVGSKVPDGTTFLSPEKTVTRDADYSNTEQHSNSINNAVPEPPSDIAAKPSANQAKRQAIRSARRNYRKTGNTSGTGNSPATLGKPTAPNQ